MLSCGACGRECPPDFAFCPACGAPLSPEGATHEVRKVVTIVFCDVTGSTALGERLDPEPLRNVMTRYFDVMRGVIERHGGTVEKFIGDAVMAVFGVPAVHEDDALRAVRATAHGEGEARSRPGLPPSSSDAARGRAHPAHGRADGGTSPRAPDAPAGVRAHRRGSILPAVHGPGARRHREVTTDPGVPEGDERCPGATGEMPRIRRRHHLLPRD